MWQTHIENISRVVALDKQIVGYSYNIVVGSYDSYDHDIMGEMSVQIMGV
jgi:hypothetical protein